MSMNLSDEAKLAIAARYAIASRTNDAELFRSLNAPESVTWHNFDGLEVSTEQTVRTIAWLHSAVANLVWTDVALLPTPNGFVSQTIMTGNAPGGPLSMHSCVVVTLNDVGLIVRAEEYLDTAQSAALRG
jgi:ketosteroid isomerase-like protein